MDIKIYTIGHSTLTIDEFIKILNAFGIELVVDVRSIPGSRHNPQFNQEELRRDLALHDIAYQHIKELGGLRHTTKASVNTAWKNSSFRGFADHMQTEGFQTGLEQLIALATKKRTVILCAEAVPWRCHRSLIGDALVVRSVLVEDIMNEKAGKPHQLTPWARVDGITITYPEATSAGEAGKTNADPVSLKQSGKPINKDKGSGDEPGLHSKESLHDTSRIG